jgi:DNA-binding NarL/FixJ family response regulator
MGGAVAKISARIEYLGKDITLSAANINYPQSFTLSDPEAQILLLLHAGKMNAEVAAEVGTDQAVVKEHIKSILRKAIGYQNRAKHLGDQHVTVQSVRHPTNPIHLVETT